MAWRRNLLLVACVVLAVSLVGVESGSTAQSQVTAEPQLAWVAKTFYPVSSVAAVSSGGVVVAVDYWGSADWAWIVKRYSADGTELWRAFGPVLRAGEASIGADPPLVTVARRGVYVLGTYMAADQGHGLVLAKYSLRGRLLWQVRIDSDPYWDVPAGVAVRRGVVAVAAYERPSGESWERDAYVVGFSTHGKRLWTNPMAVKGWADDRVQLNAMTAGPGGFYVTGSVMSKTVLGDWSPDHAILIRALTTSGENRWTRKLGADPTPDFDVGLAVSANSAGVAVAGYVNAVPKPAPGYYETNRSHAFVTLYTIDGHPVWSRTSPKIDQWTACTMLDSGDVIVAGSTRTAYTILQQGGVPKWRELGADGTTVWTEEVTRPKNSDPPWPTALDSSGSRAYLGTANGVTAWNLVP